LLCIEVLRTSYGLAWIDHAVSASLLLPGSRFAVTDSVDTPVLEQRFCAKAFTTK
jgi:hypothetical protein